MDEALRTALGVAFNINPDEEQLHLFQLELAAQGFVLMPVADVWDLLPDAHIAPCPYSDSDEDIPIGEVGCTCQTT